MIDRLGVVLTATVLSGCYAPDVRDCTVTCSSANDCAGDQVCGADGFCAAADVAGRCAQSGAHPDGPTAPVPVALHVQVMGTGKITIGSVGECGTDMPNQGDCTFQVAKGTTVTLTPVILASNKPFDRWTSMSCGGQPSICTLTITAATLVAAKFK